MPHNTNIVIKNDSTSQSIDTTNKRIYDNINQTSNYIPNSLKQKTDNINQTIRYMLKQTEPQDETSGDYSEWYKSLERREPSEESLQPIQESGNNPGFLDWLVNLTLPNPPPSSNPSIPSASVPSSPSESPPPSDLELTQQQIRERSRS